MILLRPWLRLGEWVDARLLLEKLFACDGMSVIELTSVRDADYSVICRTEEKS